MILAYKFDVKEADHFTFSHRAFNWLKENVSGCTLDIESGRVKYQDIFAPTLLDAVGVTLGPDIVMNGKHRAKVWRGDGWSMARLFHDSYFYSFPKLPIAADKCLFYFAFDDDVVAVQFKLALS
jgi:hypothetical protein